MTRVLAGVLLLVAPALHAQSVRPAVSAGMGVTYVSAPDLAHFVNATPGALERLPEFRAGAEFFGAFAFPLSSVWVLKAEYGYHVASYNINTSLETAQFTVQRHNPSLILQYVLADEGVFNLKAGAGGGYHVGSLSRTFFYFNDRFTAAGAGILAELEGNTALDERLFVHLGVNARWEFPGDLLDGDGRPPTGAVSGVTPSLNSFGIGARLGLTYTL